MRCSEAARFRESRGGERFCGDCGVADWQPLDAQVRCRESRQARNSAATADAALIAQPHAPRTRLSRRAPASVSNPANHMKCRSTGERRHLTVLFCDLSAPPRSPAISTPKNGGNRRRVPSRNGAGD